MLSPTFLVVEALGLLSAAIVSRSLILCISVIQGTSLHLFDRSLTVPASIITGILWVLLTDLGVNVMPSIPVFLLIVIAAILTVALGFYATDYAANFAIKKNRHHR